MKRHQRAARPRGRPPGLGSTSCSNGLQGAPRARANTSRHHRRCASPSPIASSIYRARGPRCFVAAGAHQTVNVAVPPGKTGMGKDGSVRGWGMGRDGWGRRTAIPARSPDPRPPPPRRQSGLRSVCAHRSRASRLLPRGVRLDGRKPRACFTSGARFARENGDSSRRLAPVRPPP